MSKVAHCRPGRDRCKHIKHSKTLSCGDTTENIETFCLRYFVLQDTYKPRYSNLYLNNSLVHEIFHDLRMDLDEPGTVLQDSLFNREINLGPIIESGRNRKDSIYTKGRFRILLTDHSKYINSMAVILVSLKMR